MSKAAYKEWFTETLNAINAAATPIRPLKAADFPAVNFDSLWRTGHKPESAAHIAFLIAEYSIPA